MNKSSTCGNGLTPLTLASGNGKVEAVRVLLEAGADVNKRSSHSRPALYLALLVFDPLSEQYKQDKAQVAALLREAGAQEPTANELAHVEQHTAGLEDEFEGDY